MTNDADRIAEQGLLSPQGGEPGRWGRRVAGLLALLAALGLASIWCYTGQVPAARELPGWVAATLAAAAIVLGLWCWLWGWFSAPDPRADVYAARRDPTPPDLYAELGLGPCQDDPACLYLDMVKRTLINLPYEDVPLIFYDGRHLPVAARKFDLRRRVDGEDAPTLAHTMIGLHRLNNVQHCIETVIREEVPGDLIETGSFLGGAVIFMRAVLKAHSVSDRRVFVADAFVTPAPRIAVPLRPILAALASIPGRRWRRTFYDILQRLPNEHQAFPLCDQPGQDWIDFFMWALRHPHVVTHSTPNSLELVRSHFARYGLLDDQVQFLPGFFAQTLPAAPLDQLAVMRLDGDTYESTRDAIVSLYPRLAPGGFCIIDDYDSFSDCRRAVDEYRCQQRITEPLQRIDRLAVYWRKSPAG